jgi:hypothetical protein
MSADGGTTAMEAGADLDHSAPGAAAARFQRAADRFLYWLVGAQL